MTVSSSTAKTGPLAGDGVTTDFDFGVQVQTAADVRVIKTTLAGGLYFDADLTLTADYTVALNADQNAAPGGTITCLVAPASGSSITVLRNVAAVQGASIPNQGGFYPKVLEDALDRLTMLVQQLQADIGRAYRISYGDTSESNISDLVSAVATSVADAETAKSESESFAVLAAASAAQADATATAVQLLLDALNDDWTIKSTAYTAASKERIFADTSAAAWTLTLPAAPSLGDFIRVADLAGSFASNNLTIGRNGLKIMGLSEDMTVSTNNAAFELVYSGATYGWRVA